jgi:hypothetical protein
MTDCVDSSNVKSCQGAGDFNGTHFELGASCSVVTNSEACRDGVARGAFPADFTAAWGDDEDSLCEAFDAIGNDSRISRRQMCQREGFDRLFVISPEGIVFEDWYNSGEPLTCPWKKRLAEIGPGIYQCDYYSTCVD